mgnify:CR=1 FL=1
MITKDEIQELLHSTETYRVERTTSTDEQSKDRGQARLDYALQGGRRREPTDGMDKFQEAICAFANGNGGNVGGNVGGKDGGDVVEKHRRKHHRCPQLVPSCVTSCVTS